VCHAPDSPHTNKVGAVMTGPLPSVPLSHRSLALLSDSPTRRLRISRRGGVISSSQECPHLLCHYLRSVEPGKMAGVWDGRVHVERTPSDLDSWQCSLQGQMSSIRQHVVVVCDCLEPPTPGPEDGVTHVKLVSRSSASSARHERNARLSRVTLIHPKQESSTACAPTTRPRC
jgi:hypothetical protein